MNLLKSFYDQFPAWLQWLFWCGLVFLIQFFLAEVFDYSHLHWLALFGLGTAIFIFLERPLIQWGFSETLETGIAAILCLIFIFHLAWILLNPRLAQEKLMAEACNPQSIEMKCYLFTRENCLAVWNQYDSICKEEVKRNQDPSRLSALMGPTIKLCTYKKFDQSFGTTRRIEPSDDCKDHFAKMDAPSL